MASKSLLIEEKNEQLARQFTPYAHYIPFDSKEELAIAIDFSVNCGELVDKITEAAYTNYRSQFSSKVFWSQVVELLKWLKKGYVMAMEVLQDKLQIINARQELIRRGVTIITGVDLSLGVFRRTLY